VQRRKMKETVTGSDAHLVWEHIQRARERFRGEHQLEEYVAGLAPEECARILAASPRGLPALARDYDRCRVGAVEERGFVEVMRTWALYVLSGLEGG
jgi:hypothetical protein